MELSNHLRIFLLYARMDEVAVRQLYNRLVKEGANVWLDHENILPGQDWESEIRKAIYSSDLVIVCLSKQFSKQGGYRHAELKIALDKADSLPAGGIFIVHARLEKCELPEPLRRWQRVDLFEENGYRKLLSTLKNHTAFAWHADGWTHGYFSRHLLYNASNCLLAEESMAHIFISYSHKDTEYAHALAASLQGMGFETWIDERLDYGSQWPQELQTRLDTCSAFILIMSPRSYASEWVQSELQRAKRKLKPIFPLLLEGDEPWLSVESTQYYDVRGEVYPDAKFYNTLKNVMTSTPGARTLQYPKGSVKAKPAKESFKLNIGLVAGAIGLLLIFGIGYAALRMRSAQQTPEAPAVPMQQSATSEPVSNEFTSVPAAVTTAQATEAPQVSNAGDDMVLVPAGQFTMGRKAVDEFAACQKFGPDCNVTWFTDEEPVHKASVNAFYIDKYEVTNALYKQCVDQGACDPPQASNSSTHLNYYGNSEFDKYPVIYVTWNQAKAYCEWRGARLPTEAEWEKAARGTDGRMYPWGDNLDETFANFNYSVGDTTPVGSYEKGKSPYGAYDMAGNVWEWVNSQDRPYPYTPDDGRESPTGDAPRVARGGSWGFVGVSVSSSYRYGFEPTSSNLDLGFRCARDTNP